MQPGAALLDPVAIEALVSAVGKDVWHGRLAALAAAAACRTHTGRDALQRHAIELTFERLRKPLPRPPSDAERVIASYAATAMEALATASPRARDAMLASFRAGLTGDSCLAAACHLLRTAAMQRARGFDVRFAGFEDGASFDLLITRDGVEAEIACATFSAEDGHGVHRGAWFRLVDRIDPELQAWLRAHPGRYLLKMTLPQGLRTGDDGEVLPALHARITQMLRESRRADHDEAAVLRLDPLMLAAAQADELGLMPRLRREFGPEAHLAVTTAGGGVFAMAARAGRENEVAVALRRRLAAIAPSRLSGTRPGILAVFVEDTSRMEWRLLQERLELEGEARQFMTCPEARGVVAVTCVSRLELFGLAGPETAPDGELRYRNPAHPAAKTEALAPAVQSSM